MSLGISIEFGFDKVPGNSDPCRYCNAPMEVKIIPFLQIGGPENVAYFPDLCEKCYQERFGEDVVT